MTRLQRIQEINEKYEQNYKFNKSGRIFTEFMGSKMWHKFDDIVEKWENFEKESNSRNNVSIVSDYIVNHGGVMTYKSMYGSRYFDFRGYKIRVSNHHWTSDKHQDPDIDLCSYEKDGYVGLVETLSNL